MTTPAHNIALLRAQMKLQLNSSYESWHPGDYLKFAKQSFKILQHCGPYDTETHSSCSSIIIQYIRSLNDVNSKFVAQGKQPTHSSMMLHSFFLCDLQQYDPAWMEDLVQAYPHAFMYIGQEWCAWTTLLR